MHRKGFLLGSAALVAGCAHHRVTGRFQDIAGDGQPLKSTFNEDSDKVRILMLVSPT